jgi:hypothetical protein
VYAEAAPFGLIELSEVAHSLCGVLSAKKDAVDPRWDKVVSVHINAMRALRSPDVSENADLRTAIVSELHRLSARFARQAASAVSEDAK